MLHYPKMPGVGKLPDGRCIAFEKYDGANLHWDWDRDFGWHAFGTRRDEFNLTPDGIGKFVAKHAQLEGAAEVFEATLADGIECVLRDNAAYQGYQSVKAFAEFLGADSFAGLHKSEDAKRLILFDVWAEGYGFIGPRQFVTDFGHLPSARVVCKGGTDVWMAKIKTYTYRDKLKRAFADD